MAISPSVTSVEDCLVGAETALSEYPPQVELAISFFENGLKINENSVELLEQFGELCANLAENDKGIYLFERVLQLNPLRARPYFYLGQMKSGQEALHMYQKCIELSRNTAETAQLVNCLCLVAELYMTDLCDDIVAEETCESALREAISINPNSFEALTSLSTFQKIRMELELAKSSALQAVALVTQFVEKGEDVDIPFIDRMRLAENLVDLELIEEALLVLSTLLDEDEEDIQAWYLTAACHLVAKEKEEASECISHAKKLLRKNPSEFWKDNLVDLALRVARI